MDTQRNAFTRNVIRTLTHTTHDTHTVQKKKIYSAHLAVLKSRNINIIQPEKMHLKINYSNSNERVKITIIFRYNINTKCLALLSFFYYHFFLTLFTHRIDTFHRNSLDSIESTTYFLDSYRKVEFLMDSILVPLLKMLFQPMFESAERSG